MAAAGLPNQWIVLSGTGKPDVGARQRIRSHVMRGKNSRSSKRAKRLAAGLSDGRGGPLEWILTSPSKVALDFSLWGIKMGPYEHELLHQALTVLKPPTPPVADILHGDDGSSTIYCFEGLFQAPALLNAVLFTAQSYRDIVVDGQPDLTDRSRLLLSATLRHLRDQLQDEKESLSDTSIAAVTTLAMASMFVMDLDSTEQHVTGLRKMIDARGGLGGIGPSSLVGKKAHRIDFARALATGRPMSLVTDRSASRVALQLVTPPPELLVLGEGLDEALIRSWSDVRDFALAANQSLRNKARLPLPSVSKMTDILPSQLLALQLDRSSPNELLRLCMLSVLKSVITPYPNLGRILIQLARDLKAVILSLHAQNATEILEVLLWGLFIAAVTIFEDFDREWIHATLVDVVVSLQLYSWEDAKSVVSRFIWIDSLYDEIAEQLWKDCWDGI